MQRRSQRQTLVRLFNATLIAWLLVAVLARTSERLGPALTLAPVFLDMPFVYVVQRAPSAKAAGSTKSSKSAKSAKTRSSAHHTSHKATRKAARK